MGTSTSSAGPASGVSFDPPWLDDLNNPNPEDASANMLSPLQGNPILPPDAGEAPYAAGAGPDLDYIEADPLADSPTVAPMGRFGPARRDLGKYIRGGDTQLLRRALGHYARKGMGGAARVARRMRASTSAGAGLGVFLGDLGNRSNPQLSLWIDQLVASNPTSRDIADAIVSQLTPPGGSADEDSLKDSMARAFHDLLTTDPDLNLLNLSESDIWSVVQFFLAYEVCSRLQFDIGQFFESARLDPMIAVERETEVRAFVRNEIAVQVSALRDQSSNPTKQQLEALLQAALRQTFEAYEGSI